MAKKDTEKPGETCPREEKVKKNMELWESVCISDPKFLKEVSYGTKNPRKFTAIDAQSQLMEATKLWGPYGKGWGVRDCVWTFIGNGEVPVGLYLMAVFYYPGGTFEIATDIKYDPNGDCFKKCLTDLTTKALSKLGFNADVFMGFHDNKYINADNTGNGPPQNPPPQNKKPPLGNTDDADVATFQKGCERCPDLAALEDYKKKCRDYIKSKSPAVKKKCTEIYKNFKKTLSQPMAQGAQKPPPPDTGPTTKESTPIFNNIIQCIGDAETKDEVMAIMNKYYEPDKGKLMKIHKQVIEQSSHAKIEELGGVK